MKMPIRNCSIVSASTCPRASYAIRDYSSSENPPILHRKESFVDPLYQRYAAFAELTRQEEDRGLLSQPEIGFKREWLRLLAGSYKKGGEVFWSLQLRF